MTTFPRRILFAVWHLLGQDRPDPPLVEATVAAFAARGFDTDVIRLPVFVQPPGMAQRFLAAMRLMDVTQNYGLPISAVVAFGFPGYHLRHPHLFVILEQLPPWWTDDARKAPALRAPALPVVPELSVPTRPVSRIDCRFWPMLNSEEIRAWREFDLRALGAAAQIYSVANMPAAAQPLLPLVAAACPPTAIAQILVAAVEARR